MKKSRCFLIVVVCLSAVVFFFRKAIVLSAVKVVLALAVGKQASFTYEKIGWEAEHIRLDEVAYANPNVEVAIDQVNLTFSLFSLSGEVKVMRPHVHVKQGAVSTSLPWVHLLSSRLAHLHWDVSDGVIDYPEHDPVYFTFLSDKENIDTLGKIWLSYEPQETAQPLLSMQLKRSAGLFELQFSLHDENLARNPLSFFDLHGSVGIQGTLLFDERRFHEATLAMQGELERKEFALQAVGKQVDEAFLLKLHLESPQEVHADFTFTHTVGSLEIQGAMQIDGHTCNSGITLDCPASTLTSLFWKKGRSFKLREGWFAAEALPETAYASLLHFIAPEVTLKGRVACTGNFDPSYVALAIQAEQCTVGQGGAELTFSTSEAAPIHLVYALAEKKWEGSIPVQKATLAHGKSGFTLEDIDADLRLSHRTVSAPRFSARHALCSVQGSFGALAYEAGTLCVEEAEVECQLPGEKTLTWRIPRLHILDQERPCADFRLQLKEAALECVGTVRPVGETGWEFAFFSLEGKELVVRGLYRGRFFEMEECRTKDLTCKARLSLDGSILTFEEAEGTWKNMALKGKGTFDLAARLLKLQLDNVESALPTGTLHAQGSVTADLETSTADAEGMCTLTLASPVNATVWNTKPFKLHYSKEEGYALSEGSLYVRSKTEKSVLGSLYLPKLLVSSDFEEMKISACQCSLRPALLSLWKGAPTLLSKIEWPETVEAAIDVIKKGKEWSSRGRLKEGKYGLCGQRLDLTGIGFSHEQGVLSLFAKTQIGAQELWASLCTTLERPQGSLRISDQPDATGLTLWFKTEAEDLLWDKVQGACLGIQADLKRTARTVLSGRLDIDASHIGQLFSKEIREKIERTQIGKGYRWQGDLVLGKDPKRLFQMTGTITGQEWELGGYRFDRLHAGLDAHPDLILLSEVQIEDAAGSAAIKKIELVKKEQWEISIPIVSIREWHPSSMRPLVASAKGDKPFRIRNFTVSGIRGLLGNADALQGHGRLTFTNGFKKEASLLDAPLEIIKNFGLDPGLLTPVQGELEVDLHGDRLYLTTLKDAFSEGKRSEFYLAPGRTPSYIGLDGKMHIDLKMRQDVTLKVTEACVLTIRGTLDNPRYGLQF